MNNIKENMEKISQKKQEVNKTDLLRKKRKRRFGAFIKENNNNNILKTNIENIDKENIPVNEILLGDSSIVDNHLEDFKYPPMKMIEMITNTEKNRGYDFIMQYSQINNKNYFYKNEVNIFSQKLGIKAQGFGKTRKEAENKCALNCLTMIFKNKFKTFYELHNYFENKNGKYLDIIL